MYSLGKKIVFTLAFLVVLVGNHGVQASAVVGQRRCHSFYHRTLGALTFFVEHNQPYKGIVRITIKNDKGSKCGQVCFRPVAEASVAEIAAFKKVIAVKDLAHYAYVSDLKVEQGYWEKKLCPVLFLVLEKELKYSATRECAL